MKNLIDFLKTVEAGVDPRLCLQCFQSSFFAVFAEYLHQDLHQTTVRNKYVMQCDVT